MKIKDIEKQLKNEIEAHSPSFESVLSKCKKDTDDINKEKCLVPVTAGAPTRLQASRGIIKYALPAIFAAILATIIIFMCLPPSTSEFTGGYFVIDINPSLEISYDKNGNVIAVTALNEDAEVLLYELDFEGKSYTEAIELIVDNCVALGFLSPQREDNAILTTAISEQGVKDEKMTEKIKEVFSNTLTQKNVQGEVLTGVQNEELNKEAEKYGIDGQKLSLIQKYVELGGEIEEGQYSEITIRELYHSICQKEKDIKKEKIDNLNSEKTKLESEMLGKITEELDALKNILPENSELKNWLENVTEGDCVDEQIDSLLEMLGGMEGSEFISGILTELESKNDEYKKAQDELNELNKTVEEKKNDRLNKDNNDKPSSENKEPHNTENGEAHFPKEDEHLPHNKDDEKGENQPSVDTNEQPYIEESKPNDGNSPKEEQKPTIEEIPPVEEENPRDEHNPHRNKH